MEETIRCCSTQVFRLGNFLCILSGTTLKSLFVGMSASEIVMRKLGLKNRYDSAKIGVAGAPDIILTPVRPVLAIFPHAECQAKEQLVQILESLRYDTAGDPVHNLPIPRRLYPLSHWDQCHPSFSVS